MKFYGIDDADITTYLAGPDVAFNAGTALDQIAVQKYIALFMNGGYEAFFNKEEPVYRHLMWAPALIMI